jgi:3-deoxy-manno-octulosonate cytidylyltransferase (CMP-KDO synthetase)
MSLRLIIPARYGSTRFPGKPLALINGVPLLQRVWALGISVAEKDNVIVATDDKRIADFCAKIGAACVMTDPAIANGTERVHAALHQLPGDVDQVINLQGDAVLTPPWVIRAVMAAMEQESALSPPPLLSAEALAKADGEGLGAGYGKVAPPPAKTNDLLAQAKVFASSPSRGEGLISCKTFVGIFTPAVRMTKESLEKLRTAKTAGEVGGTTVTFDKQHNALYFSKSIIPFVRDGMENPPVYRHIGLYGYRRATLAQLIALPPGPLEQAEKLEQLRALENGLNIRVVEVDYKGRSHIGVDSEADARRAEAIIAAEGELLPVYDGSYRFSS